MKREACEELWPSGLCDAVWPILRSSGCNAAGRTNAGLWRSSQSSYRVEGKSKSDRQLVEIIWETSLAESAVLEMKLLARKPGIRRRLEEK